MTTIEYYFIDDLWDIIKSYMIFIIHKDGKHLKNDIYIQNYNKSMQYIKYSLICNVKEIGIPYIVKRTMTVSVQERYKFIKYLYYIKYNNIQKLIIEYILNTKNVIDNYDSIERNWYKNIYNNHNIYSKCNCNNCLIYKLK